MAMIDPTRAAEGLPRWAFSVMDVERMVQVGLIDPDERLELIGGELVPMAPKGIAHETLKALLLEQWIPAKPNTVMIVPETTFRLSDQTFLEPDLLVLRRSDGLAGLTGDKALLVVEIADSSFSYDTTKKAEIYAHFSVPELWVIDANSDVIRVHRQPSGPGKTPAIYSFTRNVGAGETIEPLAVPELAITLSKLRADYT